MKYLILTTVLAIKTANIISQVLTNHMVAYYPFTGNANDMSGNGNHGTIFGAVLAIDRFNNTDNAFYFNGINSYIDLSNHITNLNFPQPASFSFWLTTKYDKPMTVFSTYNGQSVDIGSVIYIGNNVTGELSDELITLFQKASLSDYYIVGLETTNRNLVINTGWHHIVVVYNDTLTKIYLDNNLISTTCNWGVNNGHYGQLTVANYASIGARWNNGYGGFFHGTLDELRIYNIALTPAQVDTLFNEPLTSIPDRNNNNSFINIFPNPCQESLFIKSNFELETIEIINILGEVIYFSDSFTSLNFCKIDFTGEPKGIYFLKISDGETIYLRKFEKK